MARMTLRVCSFPGCPELVKPPHSTCPKHTKPRKTQKWVDPKPRPSMAARGYGKDWQIIRNQFIALHPRCEVCGEPATIAHHIIRKRDGGTDEPDNLMALCTSCHSKYHAHSGDAWNTRGRRKRN